MDLEYTGLNIILALEALPAHYRIDALLYYFKKLSLPI